MTTPSPEQEEIAREAAYIIIPNGNLALFDVAVNAISKAIARAVELNEESHAWEISPAMAQAKIDELNRQLAGAEQMSKNIKLTPAQKKAREDRKQLQAQSEDTARLLQFARLVMSEWDSDPRSTQCFDAAIIRMGREAIDAARKEAK